MNENEHISIKFIDNLLHSTDSSAHIKDVSSGKYVDSNVINVQKFGLNKPEDIIGFTIYDLNNIMKSNWDSKIVNDISDMEKLAVASLKSVADKRIFLSMDGRVWMHDMIKIPIINSRGKVNSIYTTSNNITSSLGLRNLLNTYLKFYNTHALKPIGIKKYMEHINILPNFYKLPTEGELKILIAKVKYSASKNIANDLDLSLSTVHRHLENLKTKTNSDLSKIISLIKIVD